MEKNNAIYYTMLVNILIISFFFLILQQFLNSCKREGLENSAGTYQNYPEDPLILGKQNAGNIEVLKQEIIEIPELKKRVTNLEEDVKLLNDQIQGLNQQNADAVSAFSSSTSNLTSTTGDSSGSNTTSSSTDISSSFGSGSGSDSLTTYF
jgi:peptidoglycan hydrolase CwlO-like protein